MSIDEMIAKTVGAVIEEKFNKFLNKVDERNNLLFYTLPEAHNITGIGYMKLKAAVDNNEIPFTKDGLQKKIIKIRHTDLYNYINQLTNKNYRKNK